MIISRNELKNFNYQNLNLSKSEYFKFLIERVDLKSYIQEASQRIFILIGQIGHFTFDFIAALVLSMFFMFEKRKISIFLNKFEKSKISWLYYYFRHLFKSFIDSFGKVLQSQVLIAIVSQVNIA